MRERLPEPQAILQVYAVIVVMLSGWTIAAFLWKMSAWLLILNLGELLAIFSYGMLVNLIESLIVLSFLLALCILLPSRILRDVFVLRGTILSIGVIAAMMVFVVLNMRFGLQTRSSVLIGPFVVILLTALLLGSASKIRWLATGIPWISERLTIFLYILVPLFVILSAYVIFRNIA